MILQDEVEVEVFELTGVRIQAPLVRLTVGTEVRPTPFSFPYFSLSLPSLSLSLYYLTRG